MTAKRATHKVVNTQPCPKPKETVVKVVKIRLFPDSQQRQTFKQWFGTSRFVYNRTVEHISKPDHNRSWMEAFKIIREQFPSWANPIPFQVKKIATKDAFQALSNGIKKFKKTKQLSNLKFRSRKNPKQSCFIPKSAIADKGIYNSYFDNELKMSDKLPKNLCDSRLICHRNRWYLMASYKSEVKPIENQDSVVALDPGVRTFLTGYSDEVAFKLGDKDFSRIQRLCYYLDELESKRSLAKSKRKYRLKKAASRLRSKITDLVDELHWKVIRFLVENFGTILLPSIETSNMVNRKSRRLRSKTVRSMLTFSHYKFQQRLKHKCEELGRTLMIGDEAFTSKTVSWTGEVVRIGSRKTISSKGIVVDRDINGARNILLRALVDSPSLILIEY
jgi:putative transposase